MIIIMKIKALKFISYPQSSYVSTWTLFVLLLSNGLSSSKRGRLLNPKDSNYSFDDNKALDNQIFRLMAIKCWSIGLKVPIKTNMQIQPPEQACRDLLEASTLL